MTAEEFFLICERLRWSKLPVGDFDVGPYRGVVDFLGFNRTARIDFPEAVVEVEEILYINGTTTYEWRTAPIRENEVVLLRLYS